MNCHSHVLSFRSENLLTAAAYHPITTAMSNSRRTRIGFTTVLTDGRFHRWVVSGDVGGLTLRIFLQPTYVASFLPMQLAYRSHVTCAR